MATPALPISDLIPVSVILSASALQSQATNIELILGNSPVIDVVTRMRDYTSLTQVGTDFGQGTPEYIEAAAAFGQSPQPAKIRIGRWAQTATPGQLFGAPLTTTQQQIATWNAITAGSFKIAVNGASATNITGLNFAALANLNAVAAAITAAATGAFTVVWNSVYSRFEFTGSTTGAASTLSFLTAGTGGTDISGMLKGLSTNTGAYTAAGIIAESALAAATYFDQTYGRSWYALVMPTITTDADRLAVVTYIQAASTKHFFGLTSNDAGIITTGNNSNIGKQFSSASITRAAIQYSSLSTSAVSSLLQKYLTVDYTGTDTVVNGMWKTEPGIPAETLTESQKTAMLLNNVNGYLNYDNGASIIQPGTTPTTNTFIDTVIGIDVLSLSIQAALFTLFYTRNVVGQDDAGMHEIYAAAEQVLISFVTNGLLAPGVWTGGTVGGIKSGTYLEKGYYLYVAPVATQQLVDRASRMAVPLQIAVKLRGAVNTASVIITVNP